MNKKILLTCLIMLGIFTVAKAQTAKWQQDPISIDGVADDWGSAIRFFNSESKINYEFRNDSQNLYVIIKTNDQSMQRQMMIAGFKLKFKFKTDPAISAVIAYPGLSNRKMPPPNMNNSKDHAKKNRQETTSNMEGDTDLPENPDDMQLPPMSQQKDTIKLDGFLFSQKQVITSDESPSGIVIAKTAFERAKDMVYEFKIPIREFAGDNYNLEKISDTQIQLQILIDAPSGNKSSGGRSGMSMHGGGMGGPGGGMGGGPGGGMGGGPGGGGGGDMGGGPGGDDMGGGMGQGPGDEMGQGSSMSAKKISAKFTLATKPQ